MNIVPAPASVEIDPSTGLLQPARWLASPNCDARPPDATLDLVVIHGISLPPGHFGGDWIEAFFTNRLDSCAHPYFAEICDLRVSAHLLIRRAGELIQFVSFNDRAWHAGNSRYGERENCNDFAVGIELEGSDDTPYSEQQYLRLSGVLKALLAAYPTLSSECIVGHCDIAPGRKTDPGPSFDWARLQRELA